MTDGEIPDLDYEDLQSDAPMSINHTDQVTKNIATFNFGYSRHEEAIVLVLWELSFYWGGHA